MEGKTRKEPGISLRITQAVSPAPPVDTEELFHRKTCLTQSMASLSLKNYSKSKQICPSATFDLQGEIKRSKRLS